MGGSNLVAGRERLFFNNLQPLRSVESAAAPNEVCQAGDFRAAAETSAWEQTSLSVPAIAPRIGLM